MHPLPPRPNCPQLAHHVLKCTDPLHGTCKHEVGLTAHEVHPGSVNVPLIGLELGGQHHDDIIELVILGNLSGQASVICLSHSGLQNLEVAPRSSEHVLEPGWEGFDWGVGAGVGLSIEVDNIGQLVGPLGVGIA
jgi:hypothetical protein